MPHVPPRHAEDCSDVARRALTGLSGRAPAQAPNSRSLDGAGLPRPFRRRLALTLTNPQRKDRSTPRRGRTAVHAGSQERRKLAHCRRVPQGSSGVASQPRCERRTSRPATATRNRPTPVGEVLRHESQLERTRSRAPWGTPQLVSARNRILPSSTDARRA